ncbi:MAG: Fe-S protein assembly co-chaperone HscB [Gammaproteobacteria bacterium]|nr:Fe-S protein assembly co-chaperone HscB [Gammaproteobacteria bacterium]MDP7455103.1 Fe-S protein assembly co-chaperone HscB [Gammaproteobacteria bacterium]
MQFASQNYFQLFSITEKFHIDLGVLASRYHELQIETHPDKFADSTEQEKLMAVQNTSILNEAYATLNSPLKRAGYLLYLHDVEVEQVNQDELAMDLLMEQLQLRESLEEISNDESAQSQLDDLKSRVRDKVERCELSFGINMEEKKYPGAKELFHELQFLHKLLSEIDTIEERRLGY